MKHFLIIVFMSALFSQTGYEIAKMVDEKPTPKDMSNTTKMVLTNSSGNARTNVMLSRSKDGNKKQIIWFKEPKDDMGVSFLKIEHSEKEDEMRMWLPAFKKVRRISAKKKGDAFMGSDMSYEDLTNRELNENDYERMKDETVGEIDCYVLKITPKPVAESNYSYHISWIAKNGLFGVQEFSYDKRGQMNKKKNFTFQRLQDYFVIQRVFVEDVQKAHTTEITFTDVKVDSGINDDLFHEKNLDRMPAN